jgi:rSAM/selenodomain-associated transferase 1
MNLVFFFVRWPEPGAVKTRLAESIGDEGAANLYRVMAEEQVSRLRAGSTGVYTLILYGTPVEKIRQVVLWLNDGSQPFTDAMPQPDAPLARRLEHAMEWGFGKLKAERVAFVGSDCPDITPEIIARAFALLETQDAAVGRADDGGFYLLALRKGEPGLFDAVTYSTDSTGDQLVKALQTKGATTDDGSLPRLRDVDRLEDYRALTEATRARLAAWAGRSGIVLP